jgi:glyoxylase-like metal-dependent hydrolase (beta-lactamase superfamily II)
VIRAYLAATVKGFPVYVHTIEHPDGLVLVDTGMIDSTPELDEEWEPVPMPENVPRDVVCVINTHLHFDHCGGNRLFPGVPIHVQRRELEDARVNDDYTIRKAATLPTRSASSGPAPPKASGACSRLPLRRGSRTRSGRESRRRPRPRDAARRLRGLAT